MTLRLVASLVLLCSLTTATQAQGIIWQLPEKNVEARFEGTYTQQNYRVETGEVGEEIIWKKRITIRALDKEMAEFNGEETTCRWVEIAVIAGKETEQGLDPGPVGPRVYKVLIPENKVYGQLKGGKSVDGSNIFIAFLPIVKGYSKVGGTVQKDDGTVEDKSTVSPLNAAVLQVYPTLALVHHYKTMTPAPESELRSVLGTEVDVTEVSGQKVVESRTHRATNKVRLVRCDDQNVAPFGLVEWDAEMVLEEKDDIQLRVDFQRKSKITEKMKIVSVSPSQPAEVQVP